jgi:hypothetical protein
MHVKRLFKSEFFSWRLFELKIIKQLIEIYALNGPTARILCMLETVSQRCESSIRSTSPRPNVYTQMCVLVNYNTHAASAAAHMTPYGIVKCVYLACRKNSDKRVNARSISTCRAGIFIW